MYIYPGATEAQAQYDQAATYGALPTASVHSGETYLVRTRVVDTSWPFFHRAGLYYSDGSTWAKKGKIPSRAELLIGEANEVTFGIVNTVTGFGVGGIAGLLSDEFEDANGATFTIVGGIITAVDE